MSILIILILVALTFITMFFKKSDDQWAHIVKFGWYFIAFVIGLISFLTSVTPEDNFYEYVLFVIIGVEAADNFRIWDNSRFKINGKGKK